MTDTHACPGASCTTKLAPSILACRPHWRTIPPELRATIRREYRPGQTLADATPAYREALAAAITYLEDKP